MSDDIIETRTKPTTSDDGSLHLFRSEVYLLPRPSTVNPNHPQQKSQIIKTKKKKKKKKQVHHNHRQLSSLALQIDIIHFITFLGEWTEATALL